MENLGHPMKLTSNALRLSATDLGNNLICNHLTTLDRQVAVGDRSAPAWSAPDAEVMRQRGLAHEEAYVAHLASRGLAIADLRSTPEDAARHETINAMANGADVIVQAVLGDDNWYGRADVLRRVDKPSNLGLWSYEVYDCKLAVETKAATMLQLSLYSDLVRIAQGVVPDWMHVIPPGANFSPESHRVLDYAAYHRQIRSRLEAAVARGSHDTYPEPTEHCDVCRWGAECRKKRRDDDHLSLVAGITKLQRRELADWNIITRSELAVLPLPLTRKPKRGSSESLVRVREQARVQVQAELAQQLIYEIFPPSETHGFAMLPEPSINDVYFDLEGDPFIGQSGREYLFGVGLEAPTGPEYRHKWALDLVQERAGFEWLVDLITERWRKDPFMHVYHFGAYEPAALKRLMGRHATRENEVDRMLRGALFVDLHAVVKRAMRASVEQYSLKALEPFHQFDREVALSEAATAMRLLQHALELVRPDGITDATSGRVLAYNEDDCWSTRSLRNWLESLRSEELSKGTVFSRPISLSGSASEALTDRQLRIMILEEDLRRDIPVQPELRTPQQSGRWLLSNLLDWHRRESKAEWWEFYRLGELTEEELIDERGGLSGLAYKSTLSVSKNIPTDRYSYPPQDCEIRPGDTVRTKSAKFGEVVGVDPLVHTVDIKKTKKTAQVHPSCVYVDPTGPSSDVLADSLFRLGEWVRDHDLEAAGRYQSACDLLLRRPPRLARNQTVSAAGGRTSVEAAKFLATNLQESVLAIQGPPGAGKTYTAARMICELVKQGRKIGITASSHKVIANLLKAVLQASVEDGVQNLACVQKVNDPPDGPDGVTYVTDNVSPLTSLAEGCQILAGTAWMWARPEYFQAVDLLFIDEAGQMSLANVLAVAQCAESIVLLGDPQQLEQPTKGSHPDGAEASALEHLLGNAKTISANCGLFLDHTWRLHPNVCSFTSEMFYDSRLMPVAGLEGQHLSGAGLFDHCGLWFIEVPHTGNRVRSVEEKNAVAALLRELLMPGATWTNRHGSTRELGNDDVLIVAPYNAQVAELLNGIPASRVGTVDKFQGQEAPVAVYSMTSSSIDEAPRGMEFLYSANRLNVATSRAQALAIVIGNAALLNPECKTVRQMQLANALCRFRELATLVRHSGQVNSPLVRN